jgi:ketosteroid isomerase-like protein
VTRSRLACILLLPLALAGAAAADQPDAPLPPGPEGEILAADRERVRALNDADVAVIGELFDEELRFIHSNGVVDTKHLLIAALESGRLDYLAIRTRDVTVRAYGEAGFASGTAAIDAKGPDGKRRTITNLYTAVYAKREGRWRLVSYQSTRAAKPAPGAR